MANDTEPSGQPPANGSDDCQHGTDLDTRRGGVLLGRVQVALRNRRVQGTAGGVGVGFLIGLAVFGKPWGLPPAWGDMPEWITAIATIGLLIGAIITARYAIKAFAKQSDQLEDQRKLNAEQTKVLKLQADELRASVEQREREARERHRTQASRIFIETVIVPDLRIPQTQRAVYGGTHLSSATRISNTSEQPIYDITINWRWKTTAWGEPEYIPVLMPGHVEDIDRAVPSDLLLTADRALFSAVARFRDAAGTRWLLGPDGQFDEEPAAGNGRIAGSP